MNIRLDPSINVAAARAQFADSGQVQVMPWLAEADAVALEQELRGRDDWREVINSGDKVFELDRANQAKLGAADRAQLDAAVNAGGRSGFQHRYESIRVADEPEVRSRSVSLLDRFAIFMSSSPALDMLRDITGMDDVDFVDAQATGYRPGDFLTAHHDEVPGKNRRAAYVLGLSRDWRTEWGGLLLFHDGRNDVEAGLLPRFNCLNLFAIPRIHSVSQVASYAGGTRLSVTGWLRSIG